MPYRSNISRRFLEGQFSFHFSFTDVFPHLSELTAIFQFLPARFCNSLNANMELALRKQT